MYEISRLVNQKVGENRGRERDIIIGLESEDDLMEGHNCPENLFRNGRCNEKTGKGLPKTLNLMPKRMKEALAETARNLEKQKEISLQRREEYERKTFRPYLWINHSLSKPKDKSLVNYVGLEQWKIIDLPKDINQSGLDDQAKKIRKIIIQHQRETGGFDDMFGRITDYIYCRSYDEGYLFTVEGDMVLSDHEDGRKVFANAL